MTDDLRRAGRAAAPAALVLVLAACAAPDAEGPPPLDEHTRSELEMLDCQRRARNRPDEAQRMAECNHPRIGGG